MSFRERTAWTTLILLLLCFGTYFGALATGHVPPRGFVTVRLFLGCVLALVVLQAVLAAAFAIADPQGAHAPADERERLIGVRARGLGYYVLVAGVVLLGLPGHLGGDTIDLLNLALLALVAAEATVQAAQIVMFRRGV